MAQGKAIWKGSIGFGMSVIPVKLYTAVREQEVKFKRWHEPSNSAPKQVQMIEDVVTPLSEMSKVYELGDTRVVVTDEDLSAIAPVSKRHMQVLEFVPKASVDPLYVEKTYFLHPDTGGDYAYQLLCQALAKKQSAAICKVLMRTKEHLAMIYVNRACLCLSTMYYDHEVVADNASFFDLTPVEEDALNLACTMVESMQSPSYTASKHVDEYSDRVLAMINAKAKGTVISPVEVLPPVSPGDILETLRNELLERKVAA